MKNLHFLLLFSIIISLGFFASCQGNANDPNFPTDPDLCYFLIEHDANGHDLSAHVTIAGGISYAQTYVIAPNTSSLVTMPMNEENLYVQWFHGGNSIDGCYQSTIIAKVLIGGSSCEILSDTDGFCSDDNRYHIVSTNGYNCNENPCTNNNT